MKRVDILGVGVDAVTMEEAGQCVQGFLHSDKMNMIFTPNPEFIMEAQENSVFRNILNKGDLVVPDGIGVVIGAKILKTPLKGRVPGFDLVQYTLDAVKDKEHSVFFFGSKPGVAEEAKEKMEAKYPGIKIVGCRDGYFKKEEEASIIDEINASGADILIVGLGAPKQEIFMNNYKNKLKVKVAFGVGGSLDGMAGRVKRAPMIFQKLGLEWFYRLIKQPSRAKRMLRLPLFVIHVIQFRFRKRQ